MAGMRRRKLFPPYQPWEARVLAFAKRQKAKGWFDTWLSMSLPVSIILVLVLSPFVEIPREYAVLVLVFPIAAVVWNVANDGKIIAWLERRYDLAHPKIVDADVITCSVAGKHGYPTRIETQSIEASSRPAE